MKASFRIDNPNMLAEAQAGDLFVPLGPDLVECVCARRSIPEGLNGSHTDIPHAARFNPDAALPIVVIACRVAPGEPEYYPPGHTRMLSGAAPIAFLEQVETVALRPRVPDEAIALRSAPPVGAVEATHCSAPKPEPLYHSTEELQLHMGNVNLVDSQRIAALRALREKLLAQNIAPAVVHSVVEDHFNTLADNTRPELASKL